MIITSTQFWYLFSKMNNDFFFKFCFLFLLILNYPGSKRVRGNENVILGGDRAVLIGAER